MTLSLTENAATEIRNIVANPEVPDSAGVRITSAPTGGLTLSLAAEPVAGDTVVDESGARVFLEPTAADLLATMTLDANVDPQGQLQFAVA